MMSIRGLFGKKVPFLSIVILVIFFLLILLLKDVYYSDPLLYSASNSITISSVLDEYIEHRFLPKHDPIYSHILIDQVTELSELAKEITETPFFQRLFKTFQLGNCFLTFEHAFGSRASHCKGVGKLSSTWALILSKRSHIELNDAEVLAVQIAGLLHDVGHGPLSHLFEPIAARAINSNYWSHEENSVNIVRYIFSNHPEWLKRYALPTDFVDAVCDMIIGIEKQAFESKYSNSTHFTHYFVFSIVHAPHDQRLDADKLDYLMRDSYLTAKLSFCQKVSSHIEKLILSSQVIDDCISFHVSASYDFYHIAKAYYLLYRYVYLHPKATGGDLLLKDAFDELGNGINLYERISSLDSFSSLTDSWIDEVTAFAIYHERKYPKAANLLTRFNRGEVYELTGYHDFFYNGSLLCSNTLIDKATKDLLEAASGQVGEEDFVFMIKELSFLFKPQKENDEVNPLKRVSFHGTSLLHSIYKPLQMFTNAESIYSISSSDDDPCHYESTLHPVNFVSKQLRLYTRSLDRSKREAIRNAFSMLKVNFT